MQIVDGVVKYYNGEFQSYNWRSGKDEDDFETAIGKEIEKAYLEGGNFIIDFTDGTSISLRDDGQSCCEYRYMELDGDDLGWAYGATLLGGGYKDCVEQPEDSDYGVHDAVFLEIITSKGSITLSAHNEHNGYYGGFIIVCNNN